VQLSHVDQETSWEDVDQHGFVCLKNAKGEEIVRKGGFQHNRYLRNGGAFDAKAIANLVAAVDKSLSAAA